MSVVGRELMPIAFLAEARASGIAGGLVVIVSIDGGAPKPVGTYMAVLEDGRHCGNISGGCVEPAVAAAVLPIIAGATDRIVTFGKGSPYMDIRFPCGGGIDLLVHCDPSEQTLLEALRKAEARQPFGIAFDIEASASALIDLPALTGMRDGIFLRRHLPRTRLVLAGRGPDLEVTARVAAAAELELFLITPDTDTADALSDLDVPTEIITSTRQRPRIPLDAWTAVALLFHEHEWEDTVITHAVSAPCFYIGALGSERTRAVRSKRLAAAGMAADQIARIRGPIGLVPHAKDASTLALSLLAEVAVVRASAEGDLPRG